MNLRQWARAIQRKVSDQPVELRHKEFSAADIETILRQSIQVLAESLMRGEDLCLRDLGRFWIEEKSPRQMASNLPNQKGTYELGKRRTLRFRASARLTMRIRNDQVVQNSRTGRLYEVNQSDP